MRMAGFLSFWPYSSIFVFYTGICHLIWFLLFWCLSLRIQAGDVTDKGNFRHIALSSVISKVLEHVLLNYIESHLYISDNQFGFKAKHSTDQCIYLLKEVIQFYKSHKSPMFLCFMDASKALDRVNHWSLFKKLLLRGVPVICVRLIVFWYRSQLVCVKWGAVVSSTFTVLNGVRQGGFYLHVF